LVIRELGELSGFHNSNFRSLESKQFKVKIIWIILLVSGERDEAPAGMIQEWPFVSYNVSLLHFWITKHTRLCRFCDTLHLENWIFAMSRVLSMSIRMWKELHFSQDLTKCESESHQMTLYASHRQQTMVLLRMLPWTSALQREIKLVNELDEHSIKNT
jgi:hypothetical protein